MTCKLIEKFELLCLQPCAMIKGYLRQSVIAATINGLMRFVGHIALREMFSVPWLKTLRKSLWVCSKWGRWSYFRPVCTVQGFVCDAWLVEWGPPAMCIRHANSCFLGGGTHKLKHNIIAKCSAIWNKAYRYPALVFFVKIRLMFLPCQTGSWNSVQLWHGLDDISIHPKTTEIWLNKHWLGKIEQISYPQWVWSDSPP